VIQKELKEKEDQQIMILAHNKTLLTYLHDAIAHRNIAEGSVGYYVGGMKEAELKKSETRKIIIATYAMAAEALDIKTLTTLVLATPKTDIVQAVGRILRVKHERPMVVDIIDSHEVFLSQWQKRRKYYNENGYKIMQTKSPVYALDKWNIVEQEKKGKSKKAVSCNKNDLPISKEQMKELSGKNLLSKGASAAAMFINTSCNNADAELSEEKYRNDDADHDETEFTTDYYVNSTGNKMLKGKCFI